MDALLQFGRSCNINLFKGELTMLDNNPVKKWITRKALLPIWVVVINLLFVPGFYFSLYQLRLESQRIEDLCKETKEELGTEIKETQRLYKVTEDACNRKADICAGAACG
jgi:hypothetical protein